MKLASFLTLASLAVSAALAQSIEIAYPHPHAKIEPGCDFTVQLETEMDGNLTSTEVAIVISLLQCPKDGHCPNPADDLGSILYMGPYEPKCPTPEDAPQQNFTVQVPSSFEPHYKAQLAVTHLTLLGPGLCPYLEIKDVILELV